MDTAELLEAQGYCSLPASFVADRNVVLLAEARGLAARARSADGNYYRVNDDRSVSSPRRLSTVEAGPVLQEIHRDETRLELLCQIARRPLSPTRGSYIYYAPGDYIGLHRDAAACELTLITRIAGPLDALVVHPALADLPSEQLLAISRDHSAMPPGGTRVAIPGDGGCLLLRGSVMPHHRPAALDACTIATLCYV